MPQARIIMVDGQEEILDNFDLDIPCVPDVGDVMRFTTNRLRWKKRTDVPHFEDRTVEGRVIEVSTNHLFRGHQVASQKNKVRYVQTVTEVKMLVTRDEVEEIEEKEIPF